jgi:Domain of unknown function (DUF1707)
VATLLVSDSEREYTVGLLRKHLLTGRLTHEEFEARVDEAWHARSASDLWQALRWLPTEPPPVAARPAASGTGTAIASLTLSLIGLAILCFSFGLLSLLALPFSMTGWVLGRSARRAGGAGPARAGEVMGIAGTVPAVLLMAGCAAVVFSVA